MHSVHNEMILRPAMTIATSTPACRCRDMEDRLTLPCVAAIVTHQRRSVSHVTTLQPWIEAIFALYWGFSLCWVGDHWRVRQIL